MSDYIEANAMRHTSGVLMQPIFEFKALFNTVFVFPHKVVLKPGILGAAKEKEILFDDMSDVFLKEANTLVRGLMHFAIRGEMNQKPPSMFWAPSDENTFVFRHGNNSEAIQIKKYIDSQRQGNHSSLATSDRRAADNSKHLKPSSPCDLDDFNQYTKLSAEDDWSGIFKFNSLTTDVGGVSKELRVLRKYLQDSEVVFALTAGVVSQTTTSNATDFGLNTWLGVLTDRRILMLDHALLSESVDTQSIRHDRIQAVNSSQGWMFGKVTIDIGNRSVIIDNCDKDHVKAFTRIANEWLEHLSRRGEDESKNPKNDASPDRDLFEEIKKLAELKDSGILSEEEFSKAKASLLAKM